MATPKTQSVLRAFALLKGFQNGAERLSSAELSRRANMPDASGYRQLQTLLEIGAVQRDGRGRYRPGMLLVSLTRGITKRDLLREVCLPILQELSMRHDSTAHLGVLEDSMVTYLAKTNGPDEVITKVGAQLEAYCTGLGKVLLADLPEPELAAFLAEGDLVPLTDWTITDPGKFREEIRKVRGQGYAIDDREIVPDLRCVAVPIRDADGRAFAAMSISDVHTRMCPETLHKIRLDLTRAAQVVGSKLYPSAAHLSVRARIRVVAEQRVAKTGL